MEDLYVAYEALGLCGDDSIEDARKAYLKLALKLHPDKNPGGDSTDAFQAVARAWGLISKLKAGSIQKTTVIADEVPLSYFRRTKESLFVFYCRCGEHYEVRSFDLIMKTTH
jgi:hypothetical protein